MVLGFGKKTTAGVGCYGKLPLHGDYVSHQGESPEARRLTTWLDDGYRLTGGRDDQTAPETRFLLHGRKKGAIFGMLWPSIDHSGTRRFPFSLFAELPGKALASAGAGIPLALSPTWTSMRDAYEALRGAATPDAIRAALSQIQVFGVPEDLEEVRAKFSLGAMAAPVADRTRAVYVDVLRLTGALGPGRKGTAPEFAVRIPLTTVADPEVETTAWLSILSRRLLAPDLSAECHVFFRPRGQGEAGELFAIHRELRPEDLGFILTPTDQYLYGNLLGEAHDLSAGGAAADWVLSRAGPGKTLRDLVELDPEGFPG